ncbi:uncharacterized protein BX664DRAFT_360149 [Halteromyces radiatus]|uniref:uncharacterized protein n=1 Tax=Halteromyces radiatus TaxID=101107 RepID=UPI00221F807D|nr:uncharacterized protein BX664DRAFT_360149 [Halteromyces radiatus]KAI8086635.1 hypothetical protein BX664DRAFT_360149 [Halteromyces radiatus]
MPGLKTIDVLLKDLGYKSDYIPSKERYLVDDEQDKSLLSVIKQPLGQNIDIVIPKSTASEQTTQCKQLISTLGTRYIANTHSSTNNNKVSLEHQYKHNDQDRQDAIFEFLETEQKYINKIHALVHTIVKPLKLSCAQDKHPILKQFMCTNIFLNLEQILELHQQFWKELDNHKNDFSTVCCTFMGKMDKYRRYLLKVNDAQGFHSTEYQKNQAYRSFIIKAIKDPSFKNLSLQDLLDQPWRRITAYTLLIKNIRNYTSTSHPDFDKLTEAFTQINTIASVRDDVPTILATKSHDLYLSIKNAPCHLIKQSRSLVTHLDAIEINQMTGKLRHITIFLFCDKLMVAKRSPHAKGADICDDMTGSTSMTSLNQKKKKAGGFKFYGWVGLEHIELFHGPSDLPGSFMVRASSDFQDSVTETGYEKYFQKGARIFSYQTEPYSRQSMTSFIADKDVFVDMFYKTQAVARQYGNQDATFYRTWNDINIYSNVFDPETYTKTDIKNNVAAILLEKDSEMDIPSLLNSTRSSPWIVALVRPDSQGLKLNIWSKESLTCIYDQRPSNEEKQLDFATVFWNNVIKCERKLRCSDTYRVMNQSAEEEEIQRPPRSRSRTSMSRSTSISNISKFFGRSRSQSPSSQVVPTASKSTPQLQSSSDDGQRQRRPRAHSMSSDPTSDKQMTKPATTTRRRKLSFDASFFKIDIKSPATSLSTSTRTPEQQQQTRHSPLPFQQQKLPKQSSPQQQQTSIPPYYQNRRHSMTPTITTPTTSVSHSPPSFMHPTELPSPTAHLSSPHQSYRPNGYVSYSPSPPPSSTDSGKQRQLVEKLDALYHDMAGIGKQSSKEHFHRHTSDPLVLRPPSRNSSNSSSPISMNLPTFNYHPSSSSPGGNFGTSSSRSSSYTNTFSSYGSQSSRSSLSLEEMEQNKPYDMMDDLPSSFNKQFNSEMDEIITIVNAYRQGQQRRNSLYDSPAHEVDTLLKRKLKEAQMERDYWQRRASELTHQVNEFAMRQ